MPTRWFHKQKGAVGWPIVVHRSYPRDDGDERRSRHLDEHDLMAVNGRTKTSSTHRTTPFGRRSSESWCTRSGSARGKRLPDVPTAPSPFGYWASFWQPQRGSNPCLHLERAIGPSAGVRLNRISPGQGLADVAGVRSFRLDPLQFSSKTSSKTARPDGPNIVAALTIVLEARGEVRPRADRATRR